MESIINNDELINYYNFNEDCSCISIGTKNGFKIILCEPYDNHYEYNLGSEIEIIEMYKSSNILAFTGSEKNSKFPENKLIIWDDNKKEIIKELRIISKIRIIKIIKNILFLVNDIKIYIFNFPSLTLYASFEIYSFKKEIISFNVNNVIKIAYLKNMNNIYIKHIKLYKNTKIKLLQCNKDNEQPYTYLQFNTKGNILAAGCKDFIYLYNSSNGECIKEITNNYIKEGNINCIQFSKDDKFLGISNGYKDKYKIMIFDVGIKKETNIFDNIFNYVIKPDDKCFAYYDLNFGDFLFGFDKNDKIIIITLKGDFFKISFDTKNGGNCKLIESKKLFA